MWGIPHPPLPQHSLKLQNLSSDNNHIHHPIYQHIHHQKYQACHHILDDQANPANPPLGLGHWVFRNFWGDHRQRTWSSRTASCHSRGEACLRKRLWEQPMVLLINCHSKTPFNDAHVHHRDTWTSYLTADYRVLESICSRLVYLYTCTCHFHLTALWPYPSCAATNMHMHHNTKTP